MKAKLEEARDILHEICCCPEGHYPIGLVRVGRIIEELLDQSHEWDEDDTATLPPRSLDEDSPAA